jgi:2-aminoadipate transaminase
MSTKFSKRAREAKASEVRELLKLTQNKDMIAFGGGLPAAETFPIKEMIEVCTEILLEHGAASMQYATTEGHEALRELLQIIMAERGAEVALDELLITSGSQQGLDLTAKVFIEQGDKIICEKPTYMAAINAFKPFYPQFLDVKMDEDGMIMEDLERLLQQNTDVKFIYTVPDFQNPTGICMAIERRKRLIELANQYDVLIVEDSPYSEIRFTGEVLPSIKSLDTQGRVIYLSTFSKIVCPGFRVAWVCAERQILNKYSLLKQGTDLHTNIFSQLQVVHFFRKHDRKEHIIKSREIYKKKRDCMLQALEREMPKEVQFTKPAGGMFIWVTLPQGIDSRKLLQKTLTQGVAFVPGEAFYACGTEKNTLRLNFSGLYEDQIEIGIKKLAEVIREEMN